MPNTNGIELTDVMVTHTGGTIDHETVPSNVAFDVVVEAQAGANVFGAGGHYNLQMVLTDYTANFNNLSIQNLTGTFGDANWPSQAVAHHFAVPALGTGVEDHVFRAFAVCQAGNVDPIVVTEEGQIFLVIHP